MPDDTSPLAAQNPLYAQLMANQLGQGQGLALPATLQSRLAAALAQQKEGMDISPIRSGWQGLARMANAALGGYGQYQAEQAAASMPRPVKIDGGLVTVDQYGRPNWSTFIPDSRIEKTKDVTGAEHLTQLRGSPTGFHVVPLNGGPPAPAGGRTANGAAAPTDMDQAAMLAQKKSLAEEAGKGQGAIIAAAQKRGDASDQVAKDLSVLRDIVRANSQGIVTGPTADAWMRIRQIVKGTTGNDIGDVNGLPATEAVKKLNANLANAAVHEFTNRGTQFDLRTYMENNPGIGNSPQGTEYLANILLQHAKQDRELGNLAYDPANWEKWPNVKKNYYQTHKILNPMTGHELGVYDEVGSASNLNEPPKQNAPSASGWVTYPNGVRGRQLPAAQQ